MTEKPEGTLRRALLDHVPEMVTVSDRRGRIVYANPATERVSGYAPGEFVERHPFDTIHPEDRPRCEEAFQRLLNTAGLSLELEHRVRHKDGSWCWVEGTFASLFGDPEVGVSWPPSGMSPRERRRRGRSGRARSGRRSYCA